MKTIWKYNIPLEDKFILRIPEGAMLLSIDNQNESGCLWFLVDSYKEVEDRTFHLYGTGHPIDDFKLIFIGMFQQRGGALIWHVFEEV
jgi:hypothetical protein